MENKRFEVQETLEQVLQRQVDTCQAAMDRAFVRYTERSGKLREKAEADMMMWQQRLFDSMFHLEKHKAMQDLRDL